MREDLTDLKEKWLQNVERIKNATTGAPVTSDRKLLTYADLIKLKELFDSLPPRPHIDPFNWHQEMEERQAWDGFCPACILMRHKANRLLMIPHHKFCYYK